MPDSTTSSSLVFGTQIRSIPNDRLAAVGSLPRHSRESPENVYNIEPGHSYHPDSLLTTTWPSEEQAHNLLNVVLTSIGSVQHLIDPRSISDKLSNFYAKGMDGDVESDLWSTEMLMIFALGSLLQGELNDGQTYPGVEYFLKAVDTLPSLCTLRKSGTLAIEIMGLFAFFLQCSDRKEDAYVYVLYYILI